ncbi:MAG: type II toxin-antitoxin system VapC family toxin [Betaproteobacteria bacterium]|nr:type II toxin-antitoxin system VapC family toxin [Betaproteobacteria bacterium]
MADNSVIVAWFVKSQANSYTWNILERAAAGEVIHVPLLWRQEFVNAMVVLERRHRLKASDAAQAFTELKDMNLATDRELVDLGVLAEIARRYALSAYDATYLELAIRLRLPLACRDGPLKAALPKAGVALAQPIRRPLSR